MTTDEQTTMTMEEQAAIVNAVKGIPGIVDARIDVENENVSLTVWLAADCKFFEVNDMLDNRCMRYRWYPVSPIGKNDCWRYSLHRPLEVGEAYSYKMRKPTDGKKRKKKNEQERHS